jgi:hypothetical protein
MHGVARAGYVDAPEDPEERRMRWAATIAAV